MHRHLESVRTSRALFCACWFVYAAAYVGRISYYTALDSMAGGCGFSKSEAGLIGTAFFFAYGCGQVLAGVLGDRVSPFALVFTGLSLSAAANLGLTVCQSPTVMAAVWGFNGLAQSLLWSPILYLFVHVLCPAWRDRACLAITTAVPVGTAVTYLASAALLRYADWRAVFRMGAAATACAACVWLAASLHAARRLTPDAPEKAEAPRTPDGARGRRSGGLPSLLAASGAAILLPAVLIHGMLKEGVSVWVPTMIGESYAVSPALSVLLSALPPAVSLIGPYAVDRVYKGVLKRDEARAAALCLAAVLPPLFALRFIGSLPAAACVALLALLSAAMNAFNYMTVTMVPVRFARQNRAATATGLLNAVTYMGSALSTYGFGALSERFGWGTTVAFWIALAALGAAFCVGSFRRWRNFITEERQETEGRVHNG